MPDNNKRQLGLADPVRLSIFRATFQLADAEFRRRASESAPRPQSRARGSEATRLSHALDCYVSELDLAALKKLRLEMAGGLLREFDRLLASPGSPPGERVDIARLAAAPTISDSSTSLVGLVSLPWMSPALPSIQLATIASALDSEGIASEVHELYVDYATQIGLNFYNKLSNLLGYLPEWVFSRHYYGPESGNWLNEMIAARPLDGMPLPEYADAILQALDPVTSDFLDNAQSSVDWSRYDVVGCSLTISQLGSSMAFARRLKLAHPNIKIVFGGSQCAGPMGRAILRACAYVDAVVHIEGELVFPELVRRFRASAPVGELPGVSSRDASGSVISGPKGGLAKGGADRLPLAYDWYFRRLIRLDLIEKISPWIPFEGSRGCWWGQKYQCTFCGLHEIMEFRSWSADNTIAELERLFERYRIGRFYATDLILPREYFRTFLPEVARLGRNWLFFWEIKTNMRREELAVLADAGVRWVQPGIESLDAELLDLMKKGVSPLQNIQFLKWCHELSIYCGWNLLYGLPGETPDCYRRMADIIPKIHHLQPPSGGGRFQLHRFSPYFDHPEQHGIRWTGAHAMFRFAFPIPASELNELVYLHEFELAPGVQAVDSSPTEKAVREWRRANQQGAMLKFAPLPDGSAIIEDSRNPDVPKQTHRLTPAESSLYLALDAAPKLAAVERKFPASFDVAAVVAQWLRDDLVLSIDGRVFSLAVYPDRPLTAVEPPPPVLGEPLRSIVQIDNIRPAVEVSQ